MIDGNEQNHSGTFSGASLLTSASSVHLTILASSLGLDKISQ